MSRRKITSLVACLAAPMLAACETEEGYTASAWGSTAPITIFDHVQDDDAGFREPAVELVNSREQLEALGSERLTNLEVDFARHSLVVLALGERPTGGWTAKITGVQERGDALYIQGIAYQPAAGSSLMQALTYPVAAAVITKTNAGLIHPEIDDAVMTEAAAPRDAIVIP
jgi:hypothetical protein